MKRTRNVAGRGKKCGGDVLCAVIGVGAELVGGASTGRGRRCDDLGATVCGVGGQRAVSRLCDSGGVDRVTRDGEARVARGMAAHAAPGAGGGAAPLLCDCLSRSGVVCPLVVSAHRALGWHPVLRINTGGTFRPARDVHDHPLRELRPRPAHSGWGRARRLQGPRARPQLYAARAVGRTAIRDPWLLLTDLAPSASEAGWYGLRAWIEQGFKITKRGGRQWQRTRMSDPQRAARLWLAAAHLAAAQCRGHGGGHPASEYVVALGGWRQSSDPVTASHAITLGEYLSPRLDSHPGGIAGPPASSAGPLCSRAVAADKYRYSQRGTHELLLAA